jgi:anaphase-promoting complex subunit 6
MYALKNTELDCSRYEEAARLFNQAIELAQITQTFETAWATTYVNLGTCYRKLK